MSEKICPNCNQKVDITSKFCKNCGFSFNNSKNNSEDIKTNFLNFKDDITSKIQNKLENEDILKTNDIKDKIKNLDEDSFNKLLEKYGISPSKLKLLDFNKLIDKVDINKLKDDLIEFGIIRPKHDADGRTVKVEFMDDDKNESQKNEVPLIEGCQVNENIVDEKINENTHNNNADFSKNETSNIGICSECGFQNRFNVKFCTNCGNKL